MTARLTASQIEPRTPSAPTPWGVSQSPLPYQFKSVRSTVAADDMSCADPMSPAASRKE